MAWPRCPRCCVEGVERKERANSIMAVEAEVYRSYRCSCGWTAWSVERVFTEDTPTDYIRKRFSCEEPPAAPSLSTES